MAVKIAFIAFYSWNFQNFGVRTLHSVAEQAGAEAFTIFLKNYETNQFNQPTPQEEQLLLNILKEISPGIISFTVLSPFVKTAQHITKSVRKEFPEAIFLWGGIHPTINPEDCPEDVDLICQGEGEGAITDIIHCMSTPECKPFQKSIQNINGVAPRPLIEDLDSLPAPKYGSSNFFLIENNVITREDLALNHGNYYLLTSRGCPWQCAYCVNSLLKPMYQGLGNYVRRKSIETVINEIKNFMKIGKVNYIYFNDEVFSTDKNWVEEFSIRYKKEINLPFFACYHPRMLRKELIEKLISAGLDKVDLGIQSGSDRIRNEIFNRPGYNEEIIQLSRALHEGGVKTMYDLILDNPYESKATLSDTIFLMYQLPLPSEFNLFSLQFFPKYPITERAIHDGYSISEHAMAGMRYTPKLFPLKRTRMLQNVIWLIANKVVDKNTAESATKSYFKLLLLHLKSIYHVNSQNIPFHK